MESELKVISDFYDFMLYLTQRIETLPRHHRYSLGIDIAPLRGNTHFASRLTWDFLLAVSPSPTLPFSPSSMKTRGLSTAD